MIIEVMLVILAVLVFLIMISSAWVVSVYNWAKALKQDLNTQ